jgi:hypothetical protein
VSIESVTADEISFSRPRRPPSKQRLALQYEPSGGFMRTFDEAVDEMTDSPAVFRPFAALSAAGAVVGRNVALPFYGYSYLYPNTYTVLLVPSSFFHKTTQISIVKKLIAAVRERGVCPTNSHQRRALIFSATSCSGFSAARNSPASSPDRARNTWAGSKNS